MPSSSLPTSPPAGFSFSDAAIIYEHGDRIVYKIRNKYILKRVPLSPYNSEAATHHFLTDETTIPAPRVFGEWQSPNGRYHYLLEGRIPGQTLSDVWPHLSMSTKLSLAQQVTTHMESLARFRSDRMQSVSGTQLPNNCFVPDSDPSMEPEYLAGRWSTDSDIFHHEFRPALARHGVKEDIIRALRRAMPPCADQLVFTHCDLYLGNVIVDRRRGVVTGIIDWESAGFWPAWFQYARVTYGCDSDDDEWKWMLGRLMRPNIPHADYGRVWWDTVQMFLLEPDSTVARGWLRLMSAYRRGEVDVHALREYQDLGLTEGEIRAREALRLNGRGGRGVEGYYSTALGRF